MKFILGLITLSFSVSALAVFNEVECTGRVNQKTVIVEVERFFHSPWTTSHLTIQENGNRTTSDFDMTMRYNLPEGVRYESRGFTLDVSFWPDRTPQWGRLYNGMLISREIGGYLRDMKCKFN